MQKRRVVVTGLGMVTPLGNTREDSWKAALNGTSGVATITKFDASNFSTKFAAEVKGFDGTQFVDRKEIKKMDLFSVYALAAGEEAWQDAKLENHTYDNTRMGCIYGVGMGGLGYLENNHQTYLEKGPSRISPFLIPAMISNLVAGHLGMKFNLMGPNFVISSACASSVHSIGEAYRMIAWGVQDLVVTGGSEGVVTPMGIGGFCSIRALSTRNDAPEKASRPFDVDRDGFVLGEGGITIILESLEGAEARGAKIYAEVVGYSASCDSHHITAPREDGLGVRTAMENALVSAGLKTSDVDYINMHGTSTPLGDKAESKAIKNVFGEHANNGLLCSSTKSMTGHLLGAAGAIEAGLTLLAMRDQIIPPTINIDNQDPECDLDYCANVARKAKIKVAMSNSFGFGGTNGSLILKAFE